MPLVREWSLLADDCFSRLVSSPALLRNDLVLVLVLDLGLGLGFGLDLGFDLGLGSGSQRICLLFTSFFIETYSCKAHFTSHYK